MDLSISITGIKFNNPILLASGPLSDSKAGLFKAEKSGFGGVCVKSSTFQPCQGNPLPRIASGMGYLISGDGIRNQGFKAMAKDVKEAKAEGLSIPVIMSVAGTSPEEFAEMAVEFEKCGADGIELNLVCPNRGVLIGKAEEPIGRYWSATPERSYCIVRAVKDVIKKIPVWAKTPYDTLYRDARVILKMEEAGADAVVATASMPLAMAINLKTCKPVLGNARGLGAVGGYTMKPLGINCIATLSRILKIPVIATGGVYSGLDAVEYAMVGAYGIEVLTSIMQKETAKTMIAEIEEFMSSNGYESFNDIRGKTLPLLPPSSNRIKALYAQISLV